MNAVSIEGIDKAELLAALYNGAKQQGLGRLNPRGFEEMTVDEASDLLAETQRFDYVNGRVLKVSLAGDELFTALYNRDNGDGAAEAIVDELRVVLERCPKCGKRPTKLVREIGDEFKAHEDRMAGLVRYRVNCCGGFIVPSGVETPPIFARLVWNRSIRKGFLS